MEKVSKELLIAARVLGRRGGLATARNLTSQQRRDRARKGAQARWSRARKEAEINV